MKKCELGYCHRLSQELINRHSESSTIYCQIAVQKTPDMDLEWLCWCTNFESTVVTTMDSQGCLLTK